MTSIRPVGRPIKQDKKQTLSLRLPPDLVTWIKAQDLSASLIVEEALKLLKDQDS